MPKIILKHSTDPSDTVPLPSDLDVGEPAVNVHSEYPRFAVKMADGTVKELHGVIISDTQPSDPINGTVWVNPTAKTVNVYYAPSWVRIDAGIIDTSKFMPSDADASTTGNLNTDQNLTVGGTLTIQGGFAIGKVSLTTTAGQPTGGNAGDIVMVHE